MNHDFMWLFMSVLKRSCVRILLMNICYSTIETSSHQSTHQMEAIQLHKGTNMGYDTDYTTLSGFSYLDPNFMPAS